ncbi:MAG: hypothetical protein E7508_01835 [Ruminococcus sp.]|nr:hypothetical protein [Ruminococcus sp.]
MTEVLTTKGRLIGKILIDWSANKATENENIHFKQSLCKGMQNIRFTSDNLNEIFEKNEHEDGYIICYEIENLHEKVTVTLTLDKRHIGKRMQKTCNQLLNALNLNDNGDEQIKLKLWDISEETANISQIEEVLNQVYDYEISYFETELKKWLTDHSRKIKPFPQFEFESINNTELPDEILIEGAMRDILSNKYERNLKARSRCIAYYGTACQVCGFDFGVVYGEDFAGKIEVHHIKPLYEIKEDYVVDPIKDLVPVCPNCHLVLHSKKDSVYTVEEVKEMFK